MRPERRTSIPEENGHLHDGCPFLKHTQADWLWPVEGICRARMDGRLMVPTVPHYLNLCTRWEHRLCEVLRARSRTPENVLV